MPSPFYGENSWKEKIDPAFDKPVKTYLKFLYQMERLPNEGEVTFNDESIELVRKNNNLKADYGTESGMEMFQFAENVGLLSEQELKGYLNSIAAMDEYRKFSEGINNAGLITRFFKKLYFRYVIRDEIASQTDSLMQLIEILPEEESRQYYANKVNAFVNDICTKYSSPSHEGIELIPHCILIRIVLAKIDEISEENATKEEIEYLRESTIVISKILGFINSIMYQISHQKNMRELLDNMEKSDDYSLFKAITIDNTLMSSEYVKKEVIKSLESGDTTFFDKLYTAKAKRPLESVGQHAETHAVLEFFLNVELYKLNYEELYYFLESCGLTPPRLPYAFPKFMQRYKKK
jgi:hypothetical protein